MNIVLDTNILVSALWSADSKPAIILNGVLSRRFTVCLLISHPMAFPS